MLRTVTAAFNNLIKYKGLTKQLIQRDIKLKFRRSMLGYLWSVLNPLLIMIVMTIVFSNFFRFSIDNYPLYLFSGQVIFSFFNISTSAACFTIIENGPLIRKTYIPKYIFVFSKISSCFVDFLFSLVALLFVMFFTRAHFSIHNILFIIPAIELYVFCLGMGLFLSQANVFFRDIAYIYSVFTTALNYLTPIFYPLEIIPENIRNIIIKFNPLYVFVNLFRTCVYSGKLLELNEILFGALWAIGTFIVGTCIFKKNQNRFILYI